jgi:hypothetical protein
MMMEQISLLLNTLDTSLEDMQALHDSLVEELNTTAASAGIDLAALPGGGRDKDKDKDKGPTPAEIKKLKLRKVSLIDKEGLWSQLDAETRSSIIKLLLKQEEKVKKKKNLKRTTYRLVREDPGIVDEEGLAELRAEQVKALKWFSKGTCTRRLFGIRVAKTNRTETPVPLPVKPKSETFDAASTFPSAKYKAGDMNSAEFDKIMSSAAAYLNQLQQDFGSDVQLKVTVEAGESLVTPPEGMDEGDLAKFRAQTAIEQARKYFAAQGYDVNLIDFVPITTVGKTKYVRGVSDKHADCYTKEQFLRVRVEMSGEPKPIPPIVTESFDVEAIRLRSATDTKKRRKKIKIKVKPLRVKRKKIKLKNLTDCFDFDD